MISHLTSALILSAVSQLAPQLNVSLRVDTPAETRSITSASILAQHFAPTNPIASSISVALEGVVGMPCGSNSVAVRTAYVGGGSAPGVPLEYAVEFVGLHVEPFTGVVELGSPVCLDIFPPSVPVRVPISLHLSSWSGSATREVWRYSFTESPSGTIRVLEITLDLVAGWSVTLQ